MANEDWAHEEVEAAVADYLAMLLEELRDQPLNKAAHNRALRQLLSDRTKNAVEFKHRNISAVLVELGYDYLDGYRPAANAQALLRTVVAEQMAGRPEIAALVERAVTTPANLSANSEPVIPKLVPPPKPIDSPRAVREWRTKVSRGPHPDYQQLESRNRSLGEAGERSVLAFEHARLWGAGKRALANRIEHVTKTKGDGLGYDILSFETNGRERLIEVKTTRRAEMMPFFLTRNEVEVSKQREAEYQLYRLYRFDRAPSLFILKGSLAERCRLNPIAYRAQVA